MSSLISNGGSKAYKFDSLGLEMIKSSPSSSSSSWLPASSSCSPSSESNSSSSLAMSTRKPRTPRKRPNETYNEAAALLYTAYPNVFPINYFKNPTGNTSILFDPGDLFLPLLETPRFPPDSKGFFSSLVKPWFCSGEMNPFGILDGYEDDFDAESILEKETGEGIDSIMGNQNESENAAQINDFCYGYPIRIGNGYKRAIRKAGGGDWWSFPFVNFSDVTPKMKNVSPGNKRNNKSSKSKTCKENPGFQSNARLALKLNYDVVLREWSDKASPFSGDAPPSVSGGDDVHARLAQIDLLPEACGIREARMQRYKEKRTIRRFNKKIRYQVRKVSADERPRIKGRFIKSRNPLND